MTEKLDELTTAEIEELIKKTEIDYSVSEKLIFCPNHFFEVYLYEFYTHPEEYRMCSIPIHKMYETLSKRHIDNEEYEKAEKTINIAASYNPVDIEIYETKAKLYRLNRNIEMLKNVADSMHKFCYSRIDCALYYYILGRYYLEMYEPEKACVLYEYSLLFSNKRASELDLEFLEAASHQKKNDYTTEELKNFLLKQKIPVQPKQETLALLYRVAGIEKEQKNIDYARFLYQCLFQLTGDKDVEEQMMEL